MYMAEVIKFPKDKIARPPQNEAELAASIEKVRNKFVTDAAVEFAFDVFRKMEKNGCDITSNDLSRHDLILISESIKSAMYRSIGMRHPLQKFATNVIEVSGTDTDFKMPTDKK